MFDGAPWDKKVNRLSLQAAPTSASACDTDDISPCATVYEPQTHRAAQEPARFCLASKSPFAPCAVLTHVSNRSKALLGYLLSMVAWHMLSQVYGLSFNIYRH
jgi:hypothetical protein